MLIRWYKTESKTKPVNVVIENLNDSRIDSGKLYTDSKGRTTFWLFYPIKFLQGIFVPFISQSRQEFTLSSSSLSGSSSLPDKSSS